MVASKKDNLEKRVAGKMKELFGKKTKRTKMADEGDANAYEAERARRIAANKERMKALGLGYGVLIGGGGGTDGGGGYVRHVRHVVPAFMYLHPLNTSNTQALSFLSFSFSFLDNLAPYGSNRTMVFCRGLKNKAFA